MTETAGDKLNNLVVIARKEIRHCFRDAHVWIYTIIIPLLLYPIALIGASEYGLWREGLSEKHPVRVSVSTKGRESIPELLDVIRETKKVQLVEETTSDAQAKDLLMKGRLEAFIDATEAPENIVGYVNPSEDRVNETIFLLNKLAFQAGRVSLKTSLEQAGKDSSFLDVFSVKTKNISPVAIESKSDEDSEVELFSSNLVLVGFAAYTIWILSIGAVYPALASFTEETEKSTKSTTYLLPIDHFDIVMGKFLAVTVLTLISGFVNFVSMSVVAGYFSSKIPMIHELLNFAVRQMDPKSATLIFTTFILATLMISAVYSLLAAQSKSFKEAQNVSSLVLIFSMILPMMALIPEWTLDTTSALIPVLNTVVLCKSVGAHTIDPWLTSLVFSECIVITVIALFLIQQLFWETGSNGMSRFKRFLSGKRNSG